MTIKAGKLGDSIIAADNRIEYSWGGQFPYYEVVSHVQFWDQRHAEKFRDDVQALLEEAGK